MFAAAIVEHGCETIAFMRQMDADEVIEMCEAVEMPPEQQRILATALR